MVLSVVTVLIGIGVWVGCWHIDKKHQEVPKKLEQKPAK
jgi:hypothetical protein